MGILGHSVDKYVTGTMLTTSNDRRWSHLLAEKWSHAAGELPSLVPRDTEVVVLLRGRARRRPRGRRGASTDVCTPWNRLDLPGRRQGRVHRYSRPDRRMPAHVPARSPLRRDDAAGPRRRPLRESAFATKPWPMMRSSNRSRNGSSANSLRKAPPAAFWWKRSAMHCRLIWCIIIQRRTPGQSGPPQAKSLSGVSVSRA